MASKATVQRQKSAEKVIASGRIHNRLIAEQIGARFGESAGTAAATLVTALIEDLDLKATDMVQKDEANEAELRDDPEKREQRDTAAENLGAQLVSTREQLGVILGDDYVAKLGFSGKTPSDPVELLRLGRTVTENLTEIAPPSPKIPGYEMVPAQWSEPIAALTDQMEGLTAAVADEEREAEAALTAKHAAIDLYDDTFSIAADLVSTLLQVAGQTDLAKRVRPSTRRSGQTAEDAPSESSTTAA